MVGFLKPERVISASGERETSYLLQTKRYCEVEDPTLVAQRNSDSMPELQTLIVKTWSVGGATTEWRLRYNGALYDIEKVTRQRGSITFYTVRRIDLCNE